MPKTSAGILLYRFREKKLEVFLVHPGGPFWTKKDLGAWSIPKGQFEADEDPLQAARREFQEETGQTVTGEFRELSPVIQSGGKIVQAWAAEGNCDEKNIHSNTFSIEWPPGSGKLKEFPEIDRAGWFDILTAREKILKGQLQLVEELVSILNSDSNYHFVT